MKNKILKIIIAVTLVFRTIIPITSVIAASGWTITYAGSTNTDRERYVASITEDYKFSGDTAMLIKYPGTKVEGEDNYVEIKYIIPDKMETGEYTLTFYNKGSKSALTEIYIGDSIVLKYTDTTPVRINAEDAPSGETNWYQFTYNFSYTSQEGDHIMFRYYGGTQQTLIDDISIVAASGGENYITDSSFDSVEEPDLSEEPYDTTDYQATNLMASGGNGKVCVSWVNPKTADIRKVKIYDTTNGDWELLSDSLSTVPGQIVYYTQEGLSSGELSRYAVTFEFSDKPSFTYHISGAPDASDAKNFGSWSIQEMKAGTAGYCPGEVTLETDENGNSYARIRSNIDGNLDSNLAGNIYIRLWQNVSLEPNSSYKLKMRAKLEDVDTVTMLIGWNGFIENGGWSVPIFKGSAEWQDYTFTYNTDDSVPEYYHIIMETPGTILIDDVGLYKVENGEEGENLITDGGFEEMVSSNVGNLNGAELVDAETDSMTLKWSGSTSRIDHVNLYRKLFDNYEYRGALDLENTTLRMENLNIGTEYTYLLKPVNSLGYEGEGIEVSAETAMPDFEVTEAKLFKTNVQVNSISGSGTYTVQTTVKDYAIKDMTYTQVVALYKDGVIVKIYVTEKTLQPQAKNKAAVKVNTNFTIDTGTGYTAEVFTLDSIESMNIIQRCKIF